MYWQEKIELVKKKFSRLEFKDPFRNGPEIIEKIVRQFHNATILNFYRSEDRKELIKSCELVKQCNLDNFYRDLEQLNEGINYWLFLINLPMSNGFNVYDCKKSVLKYLLYLSSGLDKQEFYIVDKKYRWAVFIELDRNLDRVEMYKSGNEKTPFD